MSDSKEDNAPNSPDVHFEPVIRLPEVDVKSCEEDEEELLKLRAKLYRYAANEVPPEWKERGTGFVKLLKHNEKGTVRLLMRRDKTLKVCANHNITQWMDLKPNCGSDRAWVWSVVADFADEVPTEEMLAIKFGNVENATLFKKVFEECKKIAKHVQSDSENDESQVEDLAEDLDKLAVKSDEKSETTGNDDEKSKETESPTVTEPLKSDVLERNERKIGGGETTFIYSFEKKLKLE